MELQAIIEKAISNNQLSVKKEGEKKSPKNKIKIKYPFVSHIILQNP